MDLLTSPGLPTPGLPVAHGQGEVVYIPEVATVYSNMGFLTQKRDVGTFSVSDNPSVWMVTLL